MGTIYNSINELPYNLNNYIINILTVSGDSIMVITTLWIHCQGSSYVMVRNVSIVHSKLIDDFRDIP